jgi:putative restriction endonuclease
VILNGLPLTKAHYVAFDAHLIGVDLITEFTSPLGWSKFMMALLELG